MKATSRSVLRDLVLILLILSGVMAVDASRPRWLIAQEDAEPATTEAATAEGEPATTDAAAGKNERGNYFVWLVETSGLIGAVIFLLSMYFVATTVRLFMELKPEVVSPPEITQQCQQLLKSKDVMGIYKVVKADDSMFSTLVTTGLTELQTGLAEARDAMERMGEVLMANFEKKISMLAVLGTLGPMIGLLGTLKGMISSFSVIALSDTQLKSSEVAGGISEALVLTFEGVALSVPAIYFFAVFRNRVSVLTATTMFEADEFIRHLNTATRGKGAAPPAAGQKPNA
jgi:biopolymer transport protein ExbB